jgi:hypothetical protein
MSTTRNSGFETTSTTTIFRGRPHRAFDGRDVHRIHEIG